MIGNTKIGYYAVKAFCKHCKYDPLAKVSDLKRHEKTEKRFSMQRQLLLPDLATCNESCSTTVSCLAPLQKGGTQP